MIIWTPYGEARFLGNSNLSNRGRIILMDFTPGWTILTAELNDRIGV